MTLKEKGKDLGRKGGLLEVGREREMLMRDVSLFKLS